MKERDLSNPVLDRLRSFGIRPKHALGQNFLIDDSVYDKIIEVANISQDTNVIEVGTGLGTLTEALALYAKHVVTIENDVSLVKRLPRILKAHANITLVPGNALSIPTEDLYKLLPKGKQIKIVANIPYYITGKLIRKFLLSSPQPSEIILMVQREVAERISAPVGKMSMLSIVAQSLADVEMCFPVDPQSFYPEPKVKSAVIRLIPHEKSKELADIELEKLYKLAKMTFSHRRKKLSNSLAGGFHITNKQAEEMLSAVGVGLLARPQELSLGQWAKLTRLFT